MFYKILILHIIYCYYCYFILFFLTLWEAYCLSNDTANIKFVGYNLEVSNRRHVYSFTNHT
jgi:hypothetical protein